MEIRKRAELDALYPEPQEGIIYDSPELLMMKHIAGNNIRGVMDLFRDRRQFSDAPPAVDTPYGRFEGKEQIRAFAEGFIARFEADGLSIVPKFQTRSGGRSVTEMVLNFEVEGMIDQTPMFVVADLGSRGTLEEVRMYCHSSFVPHLTPYRKPLFVPAHLEMGDPGLMTGAVREYYTALHHVPRVDVDRIVRCMHPDCVFGGYALYHGQEPEKGLEAMRRVYTRMATYIPEKVGMRYETLIDDGVTGVIEWVHVISDLGRKDLGRIAMSGIAAYMRGDDGRLISIRISDYAGMEKQIDWDQAGITEEEAKKVNAVTCFPAGVGRKLQEML
ncbi:MAG: nuclear transport factor 2 family protein [Clostridia bacterium]|nr:nuclear transport factor 2 family protein [Clostridia bacterium]